VRRIGVLVNGTMDDPEMQARLSGFRQGLARHGWVDGRTVRIETRFAASNSSEQLPSLAKELLDLQPDVILSQSPPIAIALQRATTTVPIVFVALPDPIHLGLVANLARPGGNLTGMLSYEEGITGKWLAMLKEIAPGLERAALLGNPKTTAYDYFQRAAEAMASSLAIQLVPVRVETTADIERAIASFARAPNGGLVLPPDSTTIVRRDQIITLAATHRLPAVYPARFWVAAGGLMSYGIDFVEMYRQAASYVDRILRGARPADLPVQAPTKYETTVNLKTAKDLGLPMPASLLVRSDEVIE
jgi:putative ABC transport system substrate-binding protein